MKENEGGGGGECGGGEGEYCEDWVLERENVFIILLFYVWSFGWVFVVFGVELMLYMVVL